MSNINFLDYKKALSDVQKLPPEVNLGDALKAILSDQPSRTILGETTPSFQHSIVSDVRLVDAFADTTSLHRKILDYEKAFQETDEEMARLLRNMVFAFVIILTGLIVLLK